MKFLFTFLSFLRKQESIFHFSFFLLISVSSFAQQKIEQDSTKTEQLDEVLVKAVRVRATSPITHSNITKKDLEKRNLGQDIPILLNFLPSVVTTSDAGAGVGYTGIRLILPLMEFRIMMQNHSELFG